MTHEELLAKIDQEVKDNEFACMVMAGAPDWILNSLRAIVELHKQIEYVKQFSDGEMLEGEFICNHCNYNYPCPTIQAIEKELT